MLKGWIDHVFGLRTLVFGRVPIRVSGCRDKRDLLSVTTGALASGCAYNGREACTRTVPWHIQYASDTWGSFDVLEPHVVHCI